MSRQPSDYLSSGRLQPVSAVLKHPNRAETSLEKDVLGDGTVWLCVASSCPIGRRPGIQAWLWHQKDIHSLLCLLFSTKSKSRARLGHLF